MATRRGTAKVLVRSVVAAAIEMDEHAVIHPTVYVRRANRIAEYELPPHPVHAYGGHLYAQECEALLKPLL